MIKTFLNFQDPLDLLLTNAPNLHKLILTLNENLQNGTENEMSIN